MSETETTLLPCPFCGHSDSLMREHMEGTVLHPAYRIMCDYCGASTRYTDRGNEAEVWNERAYPLPAPANPAGERST